MTADVLLWSAKAGSLRLNALFGGDTTTKYNTRDCSGNQMVFCAQQTGNTPLKYDRILFDIDCSKNKAESLWIWLGNDVDTVL